MGISTIQSYQGSQIFEAIGISSEVIDRYFTQTVSRVGGITLQDIAAQTDEQHSKAFDPLGLDTALGTDIRYDTGCFALQFCSTREEYGGLSDSRQRICFCRSSGKQHAAFTTLHIKDEAPITISIHVYRPTGSQSNTK